MSMIGAKRLYQLPTRLSDLSKNKEEDFGGFYIYLFGDFRQLPPIGDTPLYEKTSKTPNGKLGLRLFKNFDKFIELKMCHRQAKDRRFADLVERLGRGNITKSDYDLLATRNVNLLSDAEISTFDKAAHLCATNDKVAEYNLKHLEDLNQPIAEILSENHNNAELRRYEEKGCGLEQRLFLSIGCRVVLKRNLWVAAGLVNGAQGTVTAIVYDYNKLPPDPPLYILVEFDHYNGPCIINKSFPIITVKSNWQFNNKECFRIQFPLALCYATTIHKAQGRTIDKVIIDIGDSDFACGLTYVAITRARCLTDIIFKPFFMLNRLKDNLRKDVMKRRVEFFENFK